jgi:hypothetical protein
LGNTSVRKEPTQHIKNGWGAAAPTPTVKTGALTSTALNIATQLADDVAAKRTAAKRRAVEAAARLEQAEMVMKREAEEAAMALRSWGKGGGWMAKAATEQKVKTSDPSVLPVGSSWGSSIKGRSA